MNSVREGMTREEIEKSVNLDSSLLTKILKNLERSDFIIRYSQFGNKTKGMIYRLSDFYTLFYYRFLPDSIVKTKSGGVIITPLMPWNHGKDFRLNYCVLRI